MSLILLLTLTIAHAANQGVCDWPVPSYTIGTDAASGVSKTQFMRAMDKVEAAYGPRFAKRGCKLTLHRSWEDGTVNAQAWREGEECHVEMFGGLARYPGMTEGGIAEAAVHEIGHHLGGRPTFGDGSGMSVEGQADYYATRIGMLALRLDSRAPSKALADTLARLVGESKTSLPGPSLPEVSATYEEHPAAQCRRVTYEAGRVHSVRPRCWYKP